MRKGNEGRLNEEGKPKKRKRNRLVRLVRRAYENSI